MLMLNPPRSSLNRHDSCHSDRRPWRDGELRRLSRVERGLELRAPAPNLGGSPMKKDVLVTEESDRVDEGEFALASVSSGRQGWRWLLQVVL